MVNAGVEKRLWSAADQLWANTGLKPSQFSNSVLGLIFLRYAEKHFAEAESRICPVGSGNAARSVRWITRLKVSSFYGLRLASAPAVVKGHRGLQCREHAAD